MRTLVGICLMLISMSGFSYPLMDIKVYKEDIVSVYDGDTFTITIDHMPDVFGKVLPVRINGIDTPELRSSCATSAQREHERLLGNAAKTHLSERLHGANRLVLTNLSRDKYFRLLADVKVDGVDVGAEMIQMGLAVPYDGGTKTPWCSG